MESIGSVVSSFILVIVDMLWSGFAKYVLHFFLYSFISVFPLASSWFPCGHGEVVADC